MSATVFIEAPSLGDLHAHDIETIVRGSSNWYYQDIWDELLTEYKVSN